MPGTQVLHRAFHDRPAVRHLDSCSLPLCSMIGDLGHGAPSSGAIFFMGMDEIGQPFRRDWAPSAISFLPTRYSGAALTASTAATAPSRRWKTANLRAAGSPRSTSPVGRPRQAGDLQLEIVLVRPEPRHFAIGLGLAHHGQRRMLGLVDGVLHAFQADRDAFAADMAGAVAGREDRRDRRSWHCGRRRCRPRRRGRLRAPVRRWG